MSRCNGLLLLAASLLWGGVSTAQTIYRSSARPATEIVADFPFDIEVLRSGGGEDSLRLRTDELLRENLGKRKTVMLFWLTTCRPCRDELAALEGVLPSWREQVDFALVPVSIDFPKRAGDYHARAAAYPWPSYLDVDREFPVVLPGRLNGVPQVFVYDERGELVYHKRKYTPGDLEVLADILGVK